MKLKALLLDTIHHINVIEELIEDNVTKTSDWTWQKQLRFYSKSTTGDVIVKMANTEMEYSFEYLGNGQKLVRTPLTERCFLTLTQVRILFILNFIGVAKILGNVLGNGWQPLWSGWYW